MITNDLERLQPGSNSSILGCTQVGAAAVNPQVTAQSDRVVMLRSLALAPQAAAAGTGFGVIDNLFVQSWDLCWSTTTIAGQGSGMPMSPFYPATMAVGANPQLGGGGLGDYTQMMCGLWVQQTVDIRCTMLVADVVAGSVGVDDLESNVKWRSLVDSLRRSNVPPGRLNWLYGLGFAPVPAAAAGVNGQIVFQASAARPGIGPGQLVIQADPHVPGDLVITDISVSNVSQLPSLAQNLPIESVEASQFSRQGITIAKPLDLATPVSVTVQNTSANVLNCAVGFISPPAFAIAELGKSYASLPGSERRKLESIGASPAQLFGSVGRVIG
jgi:hypothetical protein